MALSQSGTDQNGHFQVQQEQSAEMEGLDLTEENIEFQHGEYQDQQQPIILEQNADLYGLGMNHLSSIHDSPGEETVMSSQTRQFNIQQQDLDEVEANLEQEVE